MQIFMAVTGGWRGMGVGISKSGRLTRTLIDTRMCYRTRYMFQGSIFSQDEIYGQSVTR